MPIRVVAIGGQHNVATPNANAVLQGAGHQSPTELAVSGLNAAVPSGLLPVAVPSVTQAPAVPATEKPATPVGAVGLPPDAVPMTATFPAAIGTAADVAEHGLSKGAGKDAVSYLDELRFLLNAHKVYPANVRTHRESGRVTVAFTITSDGRFTDLKLAEASSYPSLNLAALRLVTVFSRYRPVPAQLHATPWRVTIPIVYALPE